VDTDRRPAAQGIFDPVDVADLGRDCRHLPGEKMKRRLLLQFCIGIYVERSVEIE
jgi:hypothetical protein